MHVITTTDGTSGATWATPPGPGGYVHANGGVTISTSDHWTRQRMLYTPTCSVCNRKRSLYTDAVPSDWVCVVCEAAGRLLMAAQARALVEKDHAILDRALERIKELYANDALDELAAESTPCADQDCATLGSGGDYKITW